MIGITRVDHRIVVWIVALSLAFSANCSVKGKAMVGEFTDITKSRGDPTPMKFDSFRIQPGGRLLPLPSAKPQEIEASGVTPFSNAAANSRFKARVGEGKWSIKATGELDANFPPVHIVGNGDRVVVIGQMQWRLFDMTGSVLGRGPTRYSPIAIEPKTGLFVFMDPSGMLVGHRLADGARIFRTLLRVGSDYVVTHLALRESRLGIGGIYQFPGNIDDVDPDMILKSGIIEMNDLGDSIAVDASQTLMSGSLVRALNSETNTLVVASRTDRYVIAMENVIYVGDGELNLWAQLTGEFAPLALSLDEAGRIHLIVRLSSGQAYWLLNEKGEVLFSMRIPEPGLKGYQPPIVGFDHSVYIPVKEYILCIKPEGKGKLEYMAPGFSGAIITGDNKLLVSDGGDIVTFDSEGQREVVCSFAGETLRTAPILTDSGMMWVATDKHLYGLKPAE